MRNFFYSCALLLLCASGAAVHGQATAALPSATDAAWQHVKALPVYTKVHVEGDHLKKACSFVSADDVVLICAKNESVKAAQYSFPRSEVKSVKLTRRGVSTVAGFVIGGAAGAGIGAAIGHAVDPKNNDPNQFLNLSGILGSIITAFGGIAGITTGAIVGHHTDFLRGPVVYSRVEVKP